jgi:hypothetical protein|nr:hypothetical protein [Kofleriaceae bacterium]
MVAVVASCGGAGVATQESIGHPAPDFTAEKQLGDASPHLAELRGHIVLLDFWSPTFRSSRMSLPDLATLVGRHPDVRMLAITTAELPDLSAARSTR